MRLIHKENSFKNYFQTLALALGKMTVAFAVIFMALIEKKLQNSYKPTETISLEMILR